jgi:hypothetical protein
MNAEGMREFYERAGYRVASTRSADWYVPGDAVYKSFPYGKPVLLDRDEMNDLSRQKGIVGVEFSNTCGIGVASGIWVMRDRSYGLQSLQRQFRQRLLRTLENEQVRPIAFQDLCRLGAEANRQSLARLNYSDRHLSDPVMWRRLCKAGEQTAGAGAFASFGAHGLTSYLIYFIAGDTSYGLISKSLDSARESGSNNAVYFTYAKEMIGHPGIAAVAIGAQSVPPLEGLDRIKRHAGYRLQPCHVGVVLRPAARMLISTAAGGFAMRLGARLFGRGTALDRAQALRALVRATDEGLHFDATNAAFRELPRSASEE